MKSLKEIQDDFAVLYQFKNWSDLQKNNRPSYGSEPFLRFANEKFRKYYAYQVAINALKKSPFYNDSFIKYIELP